MVAAPVHAASVRRGSTGSVVSQVQRKLKEYGLYNGAIDGIFGSQTEAAVKQFQRYNGLTVDGIVGQQTAARLGIQLSGSSGGGGGGNSSNYNNDVYLMAKAIYGEARGEPYEGKVAVGAVILNRVKHPDFPNSISGVIYQPRAFTAVADGQINLTPDNSAMQAARDAINGWDPSGGCIYYYNPRTATSQWIFSRPVVRVIGQHRFCL
ncbi:MAG: spore cortex-lytic enzyme [Christensenellales bacterium]